MEIHRVFLALAAPIVQNFSIGVRHISICIYCELIILTCSAVYSGTQCWSTLGGNADDDDDDSSPHRISCTGLRIIARRRFLVFFLVKMNLFVLLKTFSLRCSDLFISWRTWGQAAVECKPALFC